MLCPVCDEDMAVVEVRGVDLDVCAKCRGIWFDADELRVLCEKAGACDARGVEASLRALVPQASSSKRRCPRCRQRLVEFESGAGESRLVLDRCAKGDGLWFDRGELPRVLAGSLPTSELAAVREFLGEFAQVKEA